jgi:hypothetical protein
MIFWYGGSGSAAYVANLYPRVKSYLLFANRPESIQDLFSLTTTLAEAVAVEDQRKRATATVQQGSVPRPVASGMVLGQTFSAKAYSRGKCWGCGAPGHMLRDCPSRFRKGCSPGRTGNDLGARL